MRAPRHRLTRLLAELGGVVPAPGTIDCDDLATRLGLSPTTLRRDLRDLRDALGTVTPGGAS